MPKNVLLDKPDLDNPYIISGGCNQVVGGEGEQDYIRYSLIAFIIFALYYITMTPEYIYFYIKGCPACKRMDDLLATKGLTSFTRIDLRGNENDTIYKKIHYIVGKKLYGINQAPTIMSKSYSEVNF
jgi:glutaredoxin